MDQPKMNKNGSHTLEQLGLDVDPIAASIAYASPDNVMLLDVEGHIRFINYTVPDLTVDQVLGTSVFDYVPEGCRADIRACFQRILASHQADRYETLYVAEDGAVSQWESRVGPIYKGEKIVGFAVSCSDVTERRRVAAERDRLFNISLDMMCVSKTDGYFSRINPAFERSLGYSEQEMLNASYYDLLHPDDIQPTQQVGQQIRAGTPVVDFENRYRHKQGYYVRISWHAIYDQQSNLVYAVGRDVTEKHELEQQLRQSQKMQAVGQLAGGIAHDFNNLLQAIMANVEFAHNASSEKIDSFLSEISNAADRASKLTSQLLSFSRHQPVNKESLDLHKLVTDLVGLLRRLLPENINIVHNTDENLVAVAADKSQVEQVIINLCVNARDAMPDGGTITLTTKPVTFTKSDSKRQSWTRVGEFVNLSVKDNGTGIASDIRDRIFEPFFTTKEPGKGTGLGLAMVYGILQQHDALLKLETNKGRGTEFSIYFPVGTVASIEKGNDKELNELKGRETILVAEDESSVNTVAVRILEAAGYTVISANNGEHAVESYKQHQSGIDMLLLDVVMPKMSGPEVALFVREMNPDIPILFTSGYADTYTFGDMTKSGDRVITKPYSSKELLKEVRQCLQAES